ncbi:MAG: sulfatase-like hydrolase/transferase [Opitutaceae bacterium]
MTVFHKTGFSFLVALVFVARVFAASTSERPNVIVIVSDNQSYHDLGCFGGTEVVTPNFDRMASEGVKGTRFYVTSPACTPSRGSILTGRYPQRNGLYEMIRNDMVNYKHRYTPEEYAYSPEMTLGMDPREITFGEMMRSAGYATGAIGKWDSGRARRFLPLQRGFDFFHGFANTGIDYWTHERYGIPSLFRGNQLIKEDGFAVELFTREALRFVRENRDRPFFLYLPYNAPAGSANLERTGINPPKKYLDLYPKRDPKNSRTQYLATISCMDEGVGQLLALLKELKLDEKTFVMFFPDNGAGPADTAQLRASGTQIDRMGDGGVRVSFIARWPGVIPANTSTDELISSLDVFPTLAALGGARLQPHLKLDGFNLLPVLLGKAKSPRTEMFWHSRNSKAALVGKYKWVEAPSFSGLFDLEKDAGESRDLSAQMPDVVAQVKRRWQNWRREMDEAEPRGPFRDY